MFTMCLDNLKLESLDDRGDGCCWRYDQESNPLVSCQDIVKGEDSKVPSLRMPANRDDFFS